MSTTCADVAKFLNQELEFHLINKLVVTGTVKGFDSLSNLTLDDCVIKSESAEEPYLQKSSSVVLPYRTITCMFPVEGVKNIANPWE
eukprot:TRINITY_DN2860_c0_g2_i1.p1 TRINITY_DN2860_c0_g2~~TRINITY_DN2860_c0_g2_i1.p1  ORF type:complete len:87 (+),score=17.01 TRINITY_DN2860_c0_g2_i1:49-309(+)